MKKAVPKGELRPLWTCPKCGHRFATRNLWHSCKNYSLSARLEGKSPRVLALYEHYLGLIDSLGPVTVEAKKDGHRLPGAGAVCRRGAAQGLAGGAAVAQAPGEAPLSAAH